MIRPGVASLSVVYLSGGQVLASYHSLDDSHEAET